MGFPQSFFGPGSPPPESVVRQVRTIAIPIGPNDSTTLIDITGGPFTQTFAAASELGPRFYVWMRNSSTNDITLDPNAAELIDGLTSYIMYPGEARLIQCDGSKFTSIVLSGFIRLFTTTGNYTHPPGYNQIIADVMSAGAGGGRSDIAGATAFTGGGGGARWAPQLYGIAPGTVITCTVGAGGLGGTTNGASGGFGGNSSFGALVLVIGGTGGSSGTAQGGYAANRNTNANASGLAGGANGGSAEWGGGSSGAGATGGAGGNLGGSSILGAPAGGNASSGGANGGQGGSPDNYTGGGGGAGGITPGGAGQNGANGTNGFAGFGGGGGANATTGGAGGNGGIPGAGGGAGAGSTFLGATTSGNGGNGARGQITITGVL